MKTAIIILILFCPTLFWAQKSIRIYAGLNISNTVYRSINNITGIDSVENGTNYYVLPNFGFDINIPIFNKCLLTTGIGINLKGQKSYFDSIPPNSQIDPNLRLNYIKIPIIFKYNLLEHFNIFGGYSLNYCYRKNVNFFYINEDMSLDNKFNVFNHGIVFGIGGTFGDIDISIGYEKGLNPVWDTKELNSTKRDYLTSAAFQFSIGYYLRDQL